MLIKPIYLKTGNENFKSWISWKPNNNNVGVKKSTITMSALPLYKVKYYLKPLLVLPNSICTLIIPALDYLKIKFIWNS